MATSDRLTGFQEIDGLHCDLAAGVQPATFPAQNCLHFFPGMGFRPAVWVMQRDQYGDKLIRIVGNDQPFLSKYDGPLRQDGDATVDVMAFLPDTPVAIAVRPSPTPTGNGTSWDWQMPPPSSWSWSWPGGSGSGRNGQGKPQTIQDALSGTPTIGDTSTHQDHGDQPSPVPLSGSGLFLALASVLLLGHATLRKARR